jgi:hypothetical protein
MLAAGARWCLWYEDVGLEVVDLSIFFDTETEFRTCYPLAYFIDGRQ